MSISRKVLATIACLALAPAGASAATPAKPAGPKASLASVIESWQRRIIEEKLSVEDGKNWALRNMAKFSRLDAERAELLRHAKTFGEVELLLTGAPIPEGTNLELLLATNPENIKMATAPAAKSTPTSSPTLYSDLAFTALTPCRIYDSRVSQGGTGPWIANVARPIKIGPYPAAGGGYASGTGAQGGSATGCGLDTLAGTGDIAAVMAAVSTVSQTGSGYLNFFSFNGTNPKPYGVVQYFQPGGVQTSFVVIPTDMSPPVWSQGAVSNANTEVIIDIVGYFAKPKAAALECQEVYSSNITIVAGTTDCQFTPPTCAAGFVPVAPVTKWISGTHASLTQIQADPATTGYASACWINSTGSNATMQSGVRCCRAAGR